MADYQDVLDKNNSWGTTTSLVNQPGNPGGTDTPGGYNGAPDIPGRPAGTGYVPDPGSSMGEWGRTKGAGYRDANGNWVTTQQSGAQADIDRWRQMGAEQYNRPAYQTDLTQSNETRGRQMGAADLLEGAARGNAPSAAEIAGKSAMDQALAGQVAAAGSARGGAMAQASAMRNAARVNAANQAQMTAGIQAGRAAEMATARGQYAGALQGMRQEDLGGSALEQQSELAQRQLNQQGQQFYEGLGYNTEAAQQQADLAQHAQDIGYQQNQQQMAFNQQNADRQFVSSLVPLHSISISDSRAKKPALLQAGDRHAQRPTEPSWLAEEQSRYNAREDLMNRAQRGEHVGDIIRRNPYEEDPQMESMLDARSGHQTPTWLEAQRGGGINRENPYDQPEPQREGPAPGVQKDWSFADEQPWKNDTPGPNDVYSDKEAKVEAHTEGFHEGVQHALAAQEPRGVTKEPKRPLFVRRVSGTGQQSGYTTDKAAGGTEMPPVQPGEGPATASQKDPEYLRRRAQQEAQRQADYASGAKRPLYISRTNGVGQQTGWTNDPAAKSGELMMPPPGPGPATASQKDPEYLRRYAAPAPQLVMSDEKTKEKVEEDPKEAGRKAGEKIAREAKGGIMAEGETRREAYSDERSKYQYSSEETKDVVPIGGSDEGQLRMSDEGNAYYDKGDSDSDTNVPKASMSGSSSVSKAPAEDEAGKSASKTVTDAASKSSGPATRKMTDAEMAREANRLISLYQQQTEASKTAPSAVQSAIDRSNTAPAQSSPQWLDSYMAQQQGPAPAEEQGFAYSDERTKEDANRKMKASPYAYKDEYRPPEQKPGEVNYGPMAQSLEENPITRTAIKKDHGGMRMVDMTKLTKIHSGAIANLQEQLDELKYGHGR